LKFGIFWETKNIFNSLFIQLFIFCTRLLIFIILLIKSKTYYKSITKIYAPMFFSLKYMPMLNMWHFVPKNNTTLYKNKNKKEKNNTTIIHILCKHSNYRQTSQIFNAWCRVIFYSWIFKRGHKLRMKAKVIKMF
jgi:hypothetical protein